MEDLFRRTTFAVLAGGEGSRMGRPKGWLSVGGRPILEHILNAARWPGPTLLVTSPGRQSPPAAEKFDAEAVDPIAGHGPLRGLLTALQAAATQTVVVTAVDMPGVDAELLRWLTTELHRREADRRDVVWMIFASRVIGQQPALEPLPVALRQEARPLLEHRLEAARQSLRGLAESPHVAVAPAPETQGERWWRNLNFPGDLEQWHRTSR